MHIRKVHTVVRFIGSLTVVAALLLGPAMPARAVLFRVGPVNQPSPPGNGFPVWYQDTTGLVLDLCLPRNQAQLDAGVCLILPPDQDPVAGLNLPLVFPNNFPDEAFWWNAGAQIDFPAGGRARLVLALEAAFANGGVAANDQISFGRIRVIVDAPVDGTYTVTHPYGVEVFPNVQAGKRAITFTDDVGIGAPGDFTGALQSGVGPFLVAANAPGGTPRALVTIGGDRFLSDTVALEFVTGSPFGTNYFEVCVEPAQDLDGAGQPCIRIDQFTLMGKVHQGAVGSPLAITSATYTRTNASTHVDVFATATPGPGAPTPRLSLADANGSAIPSVQMEGPTTVALGQFYGQSIPFASDTLPADVIVINTADDPPTSARRNLVDQVTIHEASYNPGTQTLTIEVSSSDQQEPPELVAIGVGSPTNTSGNGTSPSPRILAYHLNQSVPPVMVTVRSEHGGQDTEAVTTVRGGTFPPGAPVAVDDNVDIDAGTSMDIDVLANDSTNVNNNTVRIITGPERGTAVVQGGGSVRYTPNNAFVGEDTFTYTVRTQPAPNGFESNVATVTVTTNTPAGGSAPIANPDGPFSVQVNASLTIAVADMLANDDANGGTLAPGTFAIVPGSASGGTATVAANVVTFTAGAVAGPGSFAYTVANTSGAVSAPATVSLTILPATDQLTIAAARFRTGNRRWDINGTATVPGPGNVVTVVLVRNNAVLGTVGTATVDAVGAWSMRVLNSSVIATNGDSVLATSTAGGTATLAVRVTN